MRKTEVVIKEQKEDIYYCDDCKEKTHHGYTCSYCYKDICRDCIAYTQYDLDDCRKHICSDCYEISGNYQEKISLLEEEIDTLEEEMYEKCKAKRKENITQE